MIEILTIVWLIGWAYIMTQTLIDGELNDFGGSVLVGWLWPLLVVVILAYYAFLYVRKSLT